MGTAQDSSLPQTQSDTQAARIGRVLDEFLTRRARGDVISEADLLVAHPDLADELRQHLTLVGDLRPASDHVAALVRQGLLRESENSAYLARLGPFGITGYIGRGGMGIVLRAFHERLKRYVALKLLRPEAEADPRAVERFVREAQSAACLNHPNIVTIYDVDIADGVHYIAMECIDGPSLADVIRALHDIADDDPSPRDTDERNRGATTGAADQPPGSLPAGQRATGSRPRASCRGVPTPFIRRALRELLVGLGAAHRAGLIHRDIKSSNVLVDLGHVTGGGNGASRTVRLHWEQALSGDRRALIELLEVGPRIKLADFGLARMRQVESRLSHTKAVLGTPEYMSPEQVRGADDLDQRSDLYSAGVVLYEMLTGQTPFRADTPTATLHRLLHEPAPPPRKLNPQADPVLASIADGLVCKNRANRPASADVVIELLDRGVRLAPAGRLRRWALALTAAAAITLIIAAFQAGLLGGLTGWLTDTKPPGPRRVLWVDCQKGANNDQAALRISYSDRTEATLLQPELIEPRVARLINFPDDDEQLIAVGLGERQDGHNVVALDPAGARRWGVYLHDQSARVWPDNPGAAEWIIATMEAGDIDGDDQTDLVIAAYDRDHYTARLSVVDPRTGQIRPDASFWHMGRLHGLLISDEYFPDGRPALVAWGVNNKLDGYDHFSDAREECRARWEIVSVLMVLDPLKMNGLGPPRAPAGQLTDIPSADVHRYAFLDLPKEASHTANTDAPQNVPDAKYKTIIAGITPSRDVSSRPWLSVNFCGSEPDVPRPTLVLDRDLNVVRVEPSMKPAPDLPPDFDLGRYWHPLMRDGQYVNGGESDAERE